MLKIHWLWTSERYDANDYHIDHQDVGEKKNMVGESRRDPHNNDHYYYCG